MAIVRRGSQPQGQQTAMTPRYHPSWDPLVVMRELMRWDPLGEMGLGRTMGVPEYGFVPQFEIKETGDTYLFKADLPGVKEDDVDLSLTGNRLTVSGKRDEEERHEGETYYAYERSYGSFSRSFTLPEGIDADHVNAAIKDGVLTISIPKKPEVQPRKVPLGKGQQAKA